MKKKFLVAALTGLTIMSMTTGCSDSLAKESTSDCPICESTDITLSDIMEFLNNNPDYNMDLANAVAVIPFTHINGPKNEWEFLAFVNFEYRERKYVKYQVTYLSCTCRAANVNYWQTAYVEMTLPEKGQTGEDTVLRKLSFDQDGTEHYTAGFWGDSDPIYDEATGSKVLATYERDPENPNIPSIKEDFIPLLVGMTKANLDKYSTIDDLTDVELPEVYGDKTVASYFSGASVSTNNIIRILQGLFDYHAEKWGATFA